MADIAPLMNFFNQMVRRRGPPRATGRPPTTAAIAAVAPLPKALQTRNPTRAKLPQVPKVPGYR